MVFSSIMGNLHLKQNLTNNSETLCGISKTFENHKSVQRIKVIKFTETKTLDFSYVAGGEIKNKILNLSFKKPTKKAEMQVKVLKDSVNAYNKELTIMINLEKGLMN